MLPRLNWEYPPAPDSWRQEERNRFHQTAKDLLETVRKELGEEFEIINALVECHDDPDLDAYLQDPKYSTALKRVGIESGLCIVLPSSEQPSHTEGG